MKWPRKGILIRLAIYLPLIGFFAYQAFFRDNGAEEAPAAAQPKTPLEGQIIQVTPEELEQMGLEFPDTPPKGDSVPAG